MKHDEYVERRGFLNPVDPAFVVLHEDWNERFDKFILDMIGLDKPYSNNSMHKNSDMKTRGINITKEQMRKTVLGKSDIIPAYYD